MSLLKIILLLSLLPTLFSCGGQTTAQLEIASSYMSTAPFAGGFMVVGESASGKRFTISVNGSNEGKILLDADKWTFTAVGWDGGGTNKPFEGSPYCGIVKDFGLSSENSKVTIDINTANCSSSDYLAATNFNSYFNVFGCDVFYNYSPTSDTYSAVTDGNMQTYCINANNNMPSDFKSEFIYYRVSALNTLGPTPKAIGFTSECKLVNDNSIDMKLPTSKFPFIFSLYRSSAECTNSVTPQTYTFLNGITSGSPGFDSVVSTAKDTLLLATSRTKRGKSPFMSELPRLLCGTSGTFEDCFADPTPSLSVHVKVPFKGNTHSGEQAILKGIGPSVTSCPANPLTNSKFFHTDECKIEDRVMRIRPYKNEFMCQSPAFYPGSYTIRDIHAKGDFIYVLRNESPNDKLAIYTSKGKFLHEHNLGPYNLQKVAANLSGNKIIALHATGVRTYTLTNGMITFDNEWSSSGTQVEIHTTGTYYYVAGANIVSSYVTATGAAVDSLTFGNNINDLEFRAVYLHIAENNTGNVYKITSFTGEIDNTVPAPLFTATGTTSNILVEGDKILYLDGVNYYVRDITNSVTSPAYNIGTYIASPLGISITNGKVLIYDVADIQAVALGTSTPQLTMSTGICNESLTIAHGGASKVVTFEAREDEGASMIFEELFSILGRRFISNTDHPYYFFQSLSHDEEKSSGGYLRRVQEMLGPEALGAFLSEYATCTDVWNAASTPIVKNPVFRDELKGENMAFTLTVSRIAENISTFNCSATEGTCSAEQYNLLLSFAQNDGIESEKMKIKLKCGSQIGSFESYELDNGSTPAQLRKELLLYQTQFDNTARYERYSLDHDSRVRIEVAKLYKTSPDIVLFRKVDVETDGTSKSAGVTQLERSTPNTMMHRFHINASTIASFNSTTGLIPNTSIQFEDVRDDLAMVSANGMDGAPNCMANDETGVFSANVGGCFLVPFSTNPLSKSSLTLSPGAFTIENSAHPMRMPSGGVFEITP